MVAAAMAAVGGGGGVAAGAAAALAAAFALELSTFAVWYSFARAACSAAASRGALTLSWAKSRAFMAGAASGAASALPSPTSPSPKSKPVGWCAPPQRRSLATISASESSWRPSTWNWTCEPDMTCSHSVRWLPALALAIIGAFGAW